MRPIARLCLVIAPVMMTSVGRGVPPTAQAQGAAPREVTVDEGTSMSVAASPDGRTLAIDLQGSLWTLPATGGPARRITDVFGDARQPAWSPDGQWIAFFGYRDGGYDIWAVAPDGSGLHPLTWGPFDDREPAWSHEGTRVAFSSDRRSSDRRDARPEPGDYDIWLLDLRTHQLQQVTKHPAEDFMPSWSPDDGEIAFVSTRGNEQAVWVVTLEDGAERKISATKARADAPSWGPGGEVVYHVTEGQAARLETGGRPLTGAENAFPFRASWTSPTEFVYTSDGKIRRRTIGGGEAQTVEFRATLPVSQGGRSLGRLQGFPEAHPMAAIRTMLAKTPDNVLDARPLRFPEGSSASSEQGLSASLSR